jgi:hypothetical protein
MEKVFMVFEVVPYEGDYLRGVYMSSDEAGLRIEELDDESHLWGSWDVEFESREVEVGVSLSVS